MVDHAPLLATRRVVPRGHHAPEAWVGGWWHHRTGACALTIVSKDSTELWIQTVDSQALPALLGRPCGAFGRMRIVRRKLHGGIETKASRIRDAEPLDRRQQNLADSPVVKHRPPRLNAAAGIGYPVQAIDEEERAVLYPDVSGIAKDGGHVLRKPLCEPLSILLPNQDFMLGTVPSSRPRLVRPADAEREIGTARLEHFIERPMKQTLPVEPVVVVAEAFDAVLPG